MLSPEKIEQIKELFSEWLDVNDSRKVLTEQMNNLISTAAEAAGAKKVIMRKAFSFIKTKKERSVDELDEIVNIFMAVEDR
jgi:hypothetical protein